MENFIKCRDGKDREVFPAMIKDRKKVQHFTSKFRSDMAIMNIMTPDMERIEAAKRAEEDVDFSEMFTDEPYNAMMEILVMAFGNKYTSDEIETFVDFAMVPEILDIFYGISGYKKKATELKTQSAGENSPQV